ncbi:MAG: hypothetical protein HeimC3_52580 [Candidatus Heimdallarchaeota archaeon LC_3]|nr:MAG: hypothetical protein HeimC3_52580 [Candidatus Heimdallarchaeota archaeon LC_3]
MIETIFIKYNFEINRLNPLLVNDIQFLISNISGMRSYSDKMENHRFKFSDLTFVNHKNLDYFPKDLEFAKEEQKPDESNIEEQFKNWRKNLIDNIEEIKIKIEIRLFNNLKFKNNRWKILFHLIRGYNSEK